MINSTDNQRLLRVANLYDISTLERFQKSHVVVGHSSVVTMAWGSMLQLTY